MWKPSDMVAAFYHINDMLAQPGVPQTQPEMIKAPLPAGVDDTDENRAALEAFARRGSATANAAFVEGVGHLIAVVELGGLSRDDAFFAVCKLYQQVRSRFAGERQAPPAKPPATRIPDEDKGL